MQKSTEVPYWHNIYYENLVARVSTIFMVILSTHSVNDARQGSIKPIPCGVTYIYRGQLLRMLLLYSQPKQMNT